MQYKVTVAIPCYNKSRYMRRALDSLIACSRFDEFEIIVVDDRSSDNSVEIVEEYASEYPNIRLICFEVGSGSPSRPRNTAIQESTTDYLIFMDPDDVVINDGYSVLLSKMEECKSDILIGTRIGVTEAGARAFTDFTCTPYVNDGSQRVKLDLVKRRPFILKSIYSKKLILDNGIAFNESISTSEDECFDMRCVAYATKISKINDIVYQYTAEGAGSLSTAISLRVYEQMYDVIDDLYQSYSLFLSPELVADRIIGLTYAFYINKLAFLSTAEEVVCATNYILSAFEKFGYERFDGLLISRSRISLWNAIKAKNIDVYVYERMLNRARVLIAREKTQANQLKKTKKREAALKRTCNRKLVKAAIGASNRLRLLKGGKKGPAKKVVAPEITEYFKKFEEFVNRADDVPNGYWVFSDRFDNGRDNAEALYRYVQQNGIHEKIAYLIAKDSPDYQRLKGEGFNIVEFGTVEHWLLLKNAEYYFVSHCDEFILKPWYYNVRDLQRKARKENPISFQYKLIFLQHGVIRSDLSGWLGGKDITRFVTSSPAERNSLLSIVNYTLDAERVVLTGLPRWDYLDASKTQKIVTIFPTWRPELEKARATKGAADVFRKSVFFKNWVGFCNSEEVQELAKTYRVRFCLHWNNSDFGEVLREAVGTHVEIVPYGEIGPFFDVVNTSEMLVTDYSSFSFDFLYLDKPVVYFDFEENALKNNNRGEEYGRFGYYCVTLDEARESLLDLAARQYALPEEKMEAISSLLPLRDGQHCKHVIECLPQQE